MRTGNFNCRHTGILIVADHPISRKGENDFPKKSQECFILLKFLAKSKLDKRSDFEHNARSETERTIF
jgi:hypothetical protein